MSVDTILADLTRSCESAVEVLPEISDVTPPDNGISLLDVKNELFLSYLQTLALRNLVVIRSIKEGQSLESVQELNGNLTEALVHQRVYLEKGIRPLEQRIKYQVDKVVKAANDEDTKVAKAAQANAHTAAPDDSEEEDEQDQEDIDDLAYRPNPAAFAQATQEEPSRLAKSKADGVYRPPRISATAMPDLDKKERRERPMRSNTVDEYIANEMSTAPSAMPSVGSTIADGGRRTKNARALAEEAERREYEETHLMRLPPESKKERAKKRGRDRSGFVGEELRGLGENVDRIADLTRRTKTSALEKSRKRRAVEDGPRGDGSNGAFDIKRKRLDKKMRR